MAGLVIDPAFSDRWQGDRPKWGARPGMPADLAACPPVAASVAEGVPLFVCAGQLIPRKGIDLLIRALAVYRRRFGPCVLWVIGDGPERESLVQLSRRLGVEEAVTFFGTVDHQALKGAFQRSEEHTSELQSPDTSRMPSSA